MRVPAWWLRRQRRWMPVIVGLQSGNVSPLWCTQFRSQEQGERFCSLLNARSSHPDLTRWELRRCR